MTEVIDTSPKRKKVLMSAWQSTLGRRLMLWGIVVNTAIAVVFISAQLALDYRRDMSEMSGEIDYVEKFLATDIAKAAYKNNDNEVNALLKGLNGSKYILGIRVIYGTQSKKITYGNINPKASSVRAIPLEVSNSNSKIKVGQLYLAPNVQFANQMLFQRLSDTLLMQVVKTVIVSLVIILLIASLVTNHLKTIATYARNISPASGFSPLVLNKRIYQSPDEIDYLVESLNSAWSEVEKASQREKQLLRTLEQKVTERTAELEAANSKLTQLSMTDALTGLANRRKFDQVIDAELRRAKRSQTSLALLIIDVDYFKQYNDNYGHQAGDECLKIIAQIIKNATKRSSDLAARYGGEEFAVILGNSDIGSASACAKLIRKAIENIDIPNSNTDLGIVTVSVGVGVVKPDLLFDVSESIDIADEALYLAKSNGRNRVEVSSYSA